MSETSLEKRPVNALKEKGQYAAAFGVIALMLWVAGFPMFMLFFVGALAFFIWKVFSAEGRDETRRIFEFYLAANEILRDDDRRWYGFEVKETIIRGENILRSMKAAPPLIYFGLGALYQKLGDHAAAVKHLEHVAAGTSDSESAIIYPTKELREYVRMLRKIERSPAESPQTSSAIRSLERARKNRGPQLLEQSRNALATAVQQLPHSQQKLQSVVETDDHHDEAHAEQSGRPLSAAYDETARPAASFASFTEPAQPADPKDPSRKTISEVLHDIYDGNVQ